MTDPQTPRHDNLHQVITERSPCGVFVVDHRGRIVSVNAAACAMAGRKHDRMVAANIIDFVPSHAHDDAQTFYHCLLDAGHSTGELPFVHADGSERWWTVEASRIGDDRFLGFTSDVTGQRQSQDELLRDRRRLQRLQTVAGVGWWDIDLTTGEVKASSQARRIYGMPENGRVTLSDIQRCLLDDDRRLFVDALRRLRAGEGPFDVDFRVRRADDSAVRHLRSLAEYDSENQRVFGILQDVTDSLEMQEARWQSEARLNAIFDSALDFLFLKDRDSCYTHVNAAAAAFVGKTPAEVVGSTDWDLFVPEEAEQIVATDREVLAGSSDRNIFVREVQGRHRILETIKVPVRNEDGETVGLCGVSRDITEIRQLEDRLRQAQKMEAVGRLAGGVAHDFNNLLTPILGYARILLDDLPDDDPQRHDLEAIEGAGERARDITAQLLAFGRKQLLDIRVVSLNRVIAESQAMLRRLLREDVLLCLNLADDPWMTHGDVAQLYTVLLNLAVNAADAMPDGGVLTIETQNITLDDSYGATHTNVATGQYVMLAVTDDGHGMDEETLKHIFEPFFTTKAMDEGTGLGLATAHGIVQQHQGRIEVYSEPNRGTTFKVYLPRLIAEPLEFDSFVDDVLPTGTERVLVVEDDDSVRELTVAALRRYGYRVSAAALPSAAVELAQDPAVGFDVLVSDVVMPGMNGPQLHRALQGVWPELPVLFMSGYTANVMAHHGILAEGLHFIQKPFTPSDLARRVREVLTATCRS